MYCRPILQSHMFSIPLPILIQYLTYGKLCKFWLKKWNGMFNISKFSTQSVPHNHTVPDCLVLKDHIDLISNMLELKMKPNSFLDLTRLIETLLKGQAILHQADNCHSTPNRYFFLISSFHDIQFFISMLTMYLVCFIVY